MYSEGVLFLIMRVLLLVAFVIEIGSEEERAVHLMLIIIHDSTGQDCRCMALGGRSVLG